MSRSKFYAGSDSIITFTPLSLLATTGSEIMYIQFHQRKAMKQKVLTKQIDSFKIKFYKNVTLKYICISIFCFCFAGNLLSFLIF